MNHKGASEVITILIVVGLVLIATGSFWFVVKNVIDTASKNVEGASAKIFQSCEERGYSKMNPGDVCDGNIVHIGGQKCCSSEEAMEIIETGSGVDSYNWYDSSQAPEQMTFI